MFPFRQMLAPIPELFHSVEQDGPFRNCLVCTRDLHEAGPSTIESTATPPEPDRFDSPISQDTGEPGIVIPEADGPVPYMIEKIFRGTEAIVEMAICVPCLMEMQNEISEESRQVIEKEFHAKINWQERLDWLDGADGSETEDLTPSSQDNAPEVDRWLEKCLFTNEPRSSLYDYQLCGLFYGDRLFVNQLPYVLSGKAIAEISKLLSKKTRDHMQDFVETRFGMPPEFCNPETPMPMLF